MPERQANTPVLRVVLCIAAVIVVIVVLFVLPVPHERLLAASLNLFLVVVLVVSIRWGTRYAILVSILSALAFSFSMPPAGHFHYDGRVLTLFTACLVTGVVAGQLSARVRRAVLEAREAEAAARRSEQELRQSEAYLAETQRLTHTASFVWDTETKRELYLSEEWYRIYGFVPENGAAGLSADSELDLVLPRAAFEQRAWEERLQRMYPEDRERWQAAVDRAIKEKSDYELDYRIGLPDGTTKHLHVLGHPIFDASGRVVQFMGSVTDITERRRAESLLAGEKRVLEMIAKGDSLPEILDCICRLVEEQASHSLASVLLLEGNRLRHGGAPSLPKAYSDSIDGAPIGAVAGSCGTAAYRGEQVIVEDIATDPLWADYRDLALPYSLRACWSTPVFSSQRKVLATFAMYYREPRRPSRGDQEIIEQITHLVEVAIERKRTQEQLQRSEAYLAESQKLTQTGSWAWSPDSGTMLYWSEEMFRIWGFDPQHGVPDSATTWQRIHPDDLPRVNKAIAEAYRLNTKVDLEIDHRIVLPDGSVKHLHGTAHPVFDESGQVTEYIGTSVDITEFKRAEQERERLHHLETELARINRISTMGELTASLAHEINQPIAAAVTNANTSVRWLANEVPNVQEAREAAKRAAKDATRAAEIIDRIRSLFRKGAAERELIDINQIIDEMVVLLLRTEADRQDVRIRRELAAGLPAVMADRVQLQQVVLNLMMNGIDAMKAVASTRVLTAASQRNGGNQLLISVSDTGVGLPSDQGKIFEPFFTTKPHGTGMGLAISRTIIESHGGRLWATSNPGGGSTFYFTLPAVAQAST